MIFWYPGNGKMIGGLMASYWTKAFAGPGKKTQVADANLFCFQIGLNMNFHIDKISWIFKSSEENFNTFLIIHFCIKTILL